MTRQTAPVIRMFDYGQDKLDSIRNMLWCIGAQSFPDLTAAFTAGASAAGAAVFVFQGKYRGVLIQCPRSYDRSEVK